jgi:hypothetical protein
MAPLIRTSTPPRVPEPHATGGVSKTHSVHRVKAAMQRNSQALLILATLFGGSCGGSAPGNKSQSEYAEAGVITGIAVTAAVIQSARSRATPGKKKDQCCAICNRCSYPCGDTCLTIGNICFKPDGCACYDSQLPPSQRPPEPDLPCAVEPGEGTAVVAPVGGVSY